MRPRHTAFVVLSLLAPSFAFGAELAGIFEPAIAKSHAEKITASQAEYTIDVGGTVDTDNTTSRLYETFQIAFQNNLSLTIANTGGTILRNPRVVTNGKRRWWSMDELLNEILAGTKDDQEKALLIWDFVRSHRHHDDPIFVDDELHDPVKMLNVFGAGLCDDSGYVGCSLLHHAGLSTQKYGKTPTERTLHGHMMCEAILEGGYQFLDIDENAFYLDLENERPVSGDAIVRDHYLARRDHTYGPAFKGWDIGEKAAALFGRDDGNTFRAAAGHRIDFDLRPGEQIEYRWDNCGKFASDDSKGKKNRRFWGTSMWTYEPRLTPERLAEDAEQANTEVIVLQMKTPYAVCGGRLHASFAEASESPTRTVAVSLDSNTWQNVWTSQDGEAACDVEIDEALQTKQAPAKYAYFVKVSPGVQSVESLRIETDLMTSPHALPRLSLGENRVEYTDESIDPRDITITHCWRESNSVTPPKPPVAPLTPADGATVAATTVPFKWPASADATHYHIQVSRRADMRLPYRPCFDVVIDSTVHESPFAGIFNPDETYYWRVRPRNQHGVWGAWSPTWQFEWSGPRVPVDVKHEIHDREITISWNPNPRGPQPARYEVYGSNIRGFTPSKNAYEVFGLGQRRSNLLHATTETQMTVVSPDSKKPWTQCSFYRVVAVDADGVASGPSALIELPHPFLYSRPTQTVTVGKPYRYQLKTLNCLGDLQYRYAKPNYKFWEIEGHECELTEGPPWLELDTDVGILSGTPTHQDIGVHRVTITCRRTYPRELKSDDYRSSYFLKDQPRFQAHDQQTFELTVE
jgi:putative Ig domain-containing protein